MLAEEPATWLPTMARVVGRVRETRDTCTLTLQVPPGMGVFHPGQFNMVTVPGYGEVAVSISGNGGRPDRIEHTVRKVGAASGRIASTRVGEELGLRGPFGRGWPVEESRGRDVLVVAGGVGLAPLRPAIRYLLRNREHYGRVHVLYGARTPADMLYVRELEHWRGRFDVSVEVTVDRAGPGWRGHVGVVTSLLPAVRLDPARTVAWVCGPEVMMRFVAAALLAQGMQDDEIYVSLERNMQCGFGVCGHCQLGPYFVCRDGPVFSYRQVAALLSIKEL